MTSKLSELTKFVDSNVYTEIHKANECVYKDDKMFFKTSQDEPEDEGHPVSYVAIDQIASILDIPARYISRVPSDLRAFNITYFMMRNDKNLTFTMSDGMISEIRNTDSVRSSSQVIEEVTKCMGKDANIIQTDMSDKHMSFYVYGDDELDTPYGKLNPGYVFWIDMNASNSIFCNPVLINAVEETAIEVDVDIPDDIDTSSISDVFNYVSSVPEPFEELIESSKSKITDHDVAVNIVLAKKHLGKKALGIILEEMTIENVHDVHTAMRACLSAEIRVSKMSDFMNIAAFAGAFAGYKDPKFCKSCHQAIIDSME